MAQLSTWRMHIFGTTSDTNTSAYDTIAQATVAAYAGYATASLYIVKPQHTWKIEGEPLIDISGWQTSAPSRRRTFNVECYPHVFTAGTDPDLDDIDTATAVLELPYLWVGIYAGSRKYPSTMTTSAGTTPDVLYPVICTGFETSVSAPYHNVTIAFEHRNKS